MLPVCPELPDDSEVRFPFFRREPAAELGPVNTIEASGVASENRVRRGAGRRALVVSKSRLATKYDPICATTRRDVVNFPDFVVARR